MPHPKPRRTRTMRPPRQRHTPTMPHPTPSHRPTTRHRTPRRTPTTPHLTPPRTSTLLHQKQSRTPTTRHRTQSRRSKKPRPRPRRQRPRPSSRGSPGSRPTPRRRLAGRRRPERRGRPRPRDSANRRPSPAGRPTQPVPTLCAHHRDVRTYTTSPAAPSVDGVRADCWWRPAVTGVRQHRCPPHVAVPEDVAGSVPPSRCRLPHGVRESLPLAKRWPAVVAARRGIDSHQNCPAGSAEAQGPFTRCAPRCTLRCTKGHRRSQSQSKQDWPCLSWGCTS